METTALTNVERLRTESLQLSAKDRAALAHDLITSLDQEATSEEDDFQGVALGEDLTAEWAAIARERSRQLDAGEAKAIDWREAMAHIRSSLNGQATEGKSTP